MVKYASCSCRGPQFPALGFGGSQLPVHNTSLEGLPASFGLHGDPYLYVWGWVMVHWAPNRIVWSKIATPSCCGLNRKCSHGLTCQPGCWCCLGGLWNLQEFEFHWRKWKLHVNALCLESRFNESSQSPVLPSCLPSLPCVTYWDTPSFSGTVSQSKPLFLKLV